MRVPLSWLHEYVTPDLPVEALAERLTLGGLEVGAIDRIGEWWDQERIFVGEVLSVRRHPDADRLLLVQVAYGRPEPIEVVTGAPNLHVGDSGQKVILATVGARLIDGYSDTLRYQTLKRSKIRGVVSEGMVCSEKELGISNEHQGIVILPDDAPVGKPLVEYWGDVVLDIDLTPNLARALSIIGVAREASALTSSPLTIAEPTVADTGDPIEGQIDLIIQDPDLCPRYSAALIKGIRIGPSPSWMQRRLTMAGMRPINNIVDITNYVMLEWGQPLHAFDYQKLRPAATGQSPTIIVRRAHPGEKMTTLDGIERTFSPDTLLITDGGGPVAVAGVMGGLESEVTEETTDILLESANFDYISIRRTSGALRLPSEAAHRFGRGVDPELTLTALRRASDLMCALAGGKVAQGLADVYPGQRPPRVVDLPLSEVKRQLGIELSADETRQMLEKLDFACEIRGSDIRATVPSYRLDVEIAADLIEELARIYGYDALPVTLMEEQMPELHRNADLDLEESVRDTLVGCGLTEVITYSLTNLESVARLGIMDEPVPGIATEPEGYIRLANPLSREQEYLRQTLLNTSLEVIARNARVQERVAIFEIANVYLPVEGQTLPQEPRRLSVALTGLREERSWLAEEGARVDFYDLKGIVETLCARLGVADVRFAPTKHPTFQPGRVASLSLGEREIGVLGEVHPLARERFDIPEQAVCLLELDLDALLDASQPEKGFESYSRQPELREDLAFVVDEATASDEIEATIRRTGTPLLTGVVLFDVYRGPQIGAGKKSLAYRLTFQATDRTLTTEESAKQRQRIVRQLEKVYGAQIRS